MFWVGNVVVEFDDDFFVVDIVSSVDVCDSLFGIFLKLCVECGVWVS